MWSSTTRMADIDSDEEGGRKTSDRGVASSRDFSLLPLKADHERRPIWVCPNGRVFLDTQSSIYRQAYDFLIAISDPVCRPQFIHEYQITSYSLYAAASLGLQTEDILSGLTRLSKVQLADELVSFIKEKTEKCGKVKLLLNKGRYYVESIYPDVLHHLLTQPTIAAARIDDKREPVEPSAASASASASAAAPSPPSTSSFYVDRQADAAKAKYAARSLLHAQDDAAQLRDPATGFLLSSSTESAEGLVLPGTNQQKVDQRAAMGLAEFERVVNDDLPLSTKVLSFELAPTRVEEVRKVCNEMSYPMLEEFDFAKDNSTPDLPIHLKPSAQIRDYQEKSLSKMFGNGRARSGIIVLPCGAGKVRHVLDTPPHAVHTPLPSLSLPHPLPLCVLRCCADAGGHHGRRDGEEEHPRVLHHRRGGGPVAAAVPALVHAALQVHLPVHVLHQGQSHHRRAGAHHHVQHGQLLRQAQRGGGRGHEPHHYTGVGPRHLRRRSAALHRLTRRLHSPPPPHSGVVLCCAVSAVHVAPAKMFRRCVSVTHSRSKLGLTATLVREDNLVDDLFYLIGPKLYEANWLDLQTAGYIATVQVSHPSSA